VRRAAWLLTLVCACSSAPEKQGAAAGAAPRADATMPARTPVSPARVEARLFVRELRGPVRDLGALAEGSELTPDHALVLARGDDVVLALEDYARIRLFGPARVQLLPEREPALLVHEGVVSVDCAPRAARSTHSALWLADRHARLDVAASARFVLRASADKPSELAVVSGSVDVAPLVGVRELTLGGESRCLGSTNEPSKAHVELAAAERALRSGSGCGKGGADRMELAGVLARALGKLERYRGEERALLEQHAFALRSGSGDPESVRRNLAVLSAALLRERERGRALRASYEASRLATANEAAGSPEVELSERARTLIPYRE
jgi:hypothetical protein